MFQPNLVISKLGRESDVLLRNLFQHYIHDMSEWFEIDTRADGSYSFDTTAIWEKDCEAYLAQVDGSMAGFAVVGSAREWLGETAARDVHEFFVMRRFRRNGIGQSMTKWLWNEYPGEWLVRVLEFNEPAVQFWRSTISEHSRGIFEEQKRDIKGRPWRFFQWVSTECSPAGSGS